MGASVTAATAKCEAIEIIKAEHRALAEILQLLQHFLRDIAVQHTEADFALLSAALYYIDDFPCRCHHPKEDRYLFAAIRQHSPESAVALNRLQSEHHCDERFVRDLHRLFVLYQGGAPDALKRLSATLDIYAAMLLDHMHREETLLEQSAHTVPDAEWRAIAEGLAAEADPLFGTHPRQEFARLRQRMQNLLPRKMRLPAGGAEGDPRPG